MFQKLYERILISKYEGYFESGPRQYSYKARVSTEDAVTSLKETVLQHYNDEGSSVYCADFFMPLKLSIRLFMKEFFMS